MYLIDLTVLISIYYSNVERADCRSYFSALGSADFSVASSILNKDSLLLGEARTCLVSTIFCHKNNQIGAINQT